jgi:hypothetical protein
MTRGSVPGLNAFRVPPMYRGEQRNTEHSDGTEQRNSGGTLSLKCIAEQALSRLHGGTTPERQAEQGLKKGVPLGGQSVPLENGSVPVENTQVTSGTFCPHVSEQWLREWYAENPKLTCARCWLEGRGLRVQAEDGGGHRTYAGADSARKSRIATRYNGGGRR